MIMNSCRILFPSEMISACLGKCSALDASSFSTPTSLASSFCSSSTQDTSTSFSCSKSGGGGLSGSRKGVSNNLSALGGNAFETGTPRQHQAASNKKCGGAKEGWGYFVDTQSAWRETLSVGAIGMTTATRLKLHIYHSACWRVDRSYGSSTCLGQTKWDLCTMQLLHRSDNQPMDLHTR